VDVDGDWFPRIDQNRKGVSTAQAHVTVNRNEFAGFVNKFSTSVTVKSGAVERGLPNRQVRHENSDKSSNDEG
jgi:hypothetical protein